MIYPYGQVPIALFKSSVPSIGKVLPYLERMHESGQFSNFGPLVTELESRIASSLSIDPENVCSVANATLGILGAIETSPKKYRGLKIPAWTFVATAAAAKQAGVSFAFVDVNEDHRSLAYEFEDSVEVLPFGSGLRDCQSFLIDGAASFDALTARPLRMKPHQGSVISLHATKSLPAGEGGIFFSRDKKWVERFRAWTNFGFAPGMRSSSHFGINAKMPEVSAAYGLASLDAWPEIRERGIQMRLEFIENFDRLGITVAPPSLEMFANPYFLLEVPSQLKASMISGLSNVGVETRDWWGKGVHSMREYEDCPRSSLTQTNKLANTSLGIPFWHGVDKARLFDAIDRAYNNCKH